MTHDNSPDPEEEFPDWLKGMQSEEDRADSEFGDFLAGEGEDYSPDWIDDDATEDEFSSDQSDEEEIPEWLTNIREAEGTLQPPPKDTSEPAQEEDGGDPDWLMNIRKQQAEEVGDQGLGEEDALPQEEEAGERDWVSGLGEETPAGGEQVSLSSDSQMEGDDVPDWLEGMEDEGVGTGGEIPDWLSEMVDDESVPGVVIAGGEEEEWEDAQEKAAAEVDEEFPGLPGEPGEIETPSWLASLQDSSAESEIPGDATALAGRPSSTSAEDEGTFILEAADLPDWLDEVAPTDYVKEERVEETPIVEDAESEEVDISPAELPSWLQAMRPVEGETPSGLQDAIGAEATESVGPLAGLDGVLPAEPGIVHFGKPSSPITDLNVTPTQLGYATLLQSMIASEEDTPRARRRRVALPQQILRWVIAGILYAIVFFPIIWGSQSVILPSSDDVPAENLALASLVNNLPENSPVLVAFEYQPGLSGEMASASAAVIGHLLNQGAVPIIISTQPTGPGLAEIFLHNTQSQHFLIASGGYVNLGYISGGTAALLNFATDPRVAVPMQREDGGSLWDQPPLVNIRSIRDFAMVLVITDDPDTARGWIEQIQPFLRDSINPQVETYFAMVVSAQVEPL
ncbi:MAG: hypothetical protein AMK69_23985, partial [Nitrospira bacterium SG8_3]